MFLSLLFDVCNLFTVDNKTSYAVAIQIHCLTAAGIIVVKFHFPHTFGAVKANSC